MKALYLPGPAYHDEHVKATAGWWHILEYQRQAIEQAGYEVVAPEVPAEYIDNASSFSQIASYSLYTARQLEKMQHEISLIVGAPSFSHHAVMLCTDANRGFPIPRGLYLPSHTKRITYVWNQADWFRDQQLIPEYKKFNTEYRTLPINNLMNELSLKLSDRVIANSHFTKKTHSEIVPESKIKVATWGVDSERFHPGDREGFKVLFFGSDTVRKGFIYLWEALRSIVLDNMFDFELWVVGCNPHGDSNPPPNVRVFGLVPNIQVPEIIRQCHVTVLPTLEDGMPLGVQECMASGVVPIATECAAEAFEDHRSGFIVPYRDSEAILKYVKLLKESPDLLNAMSKEARSKAEEQTWEKFIADFATAVREVA